MSLFFRGETRAAQLDPLVAALTERQRMSTGSVVTPDSAARKIAIGAAQRLLVGVVRGMPVDVFRRVHGTQVEAPKPLVLVDPDGSRRGLRDFVAESMWSLVSRGNAFWRVLGRDAAGKPSQIQVLHPDAVTPRVDRSTGALAWRVGTLQASADDVVHMRLWPVPGAVVGLSPIEQHASTVGLGIAAEQFGTQFFDAGGRPVGALKSEADLNPTQGRLVKAAFMAATANREPVFLPGGMSYEALSVTPNESQFLDTQRFTSAECARIYGPGIAEVCGYESGGSMTYSNIADRNLHLLTYAVDPYLVLLEDAFSSLLAAPRYVRFNRGSLLRMSTKDRYAAYESAARAGIQTPNEARAFEDWAPVAWGDQPYSVKTPALPATDPNSPNQGATS